MKHYRRLYRRLTALKHRSKFLEERITETVSTTNTHPHYDIAELSAINFAIKFITNNRDLAVEQIAKEREEIARDRIMDV